MSLEVDGVAFIGGGNMARGLIGGLRARGTPGAAIHVVEPDDTVRARLAAEFGVSTDAGAGAAATAMGTWVFAVKPQVMRAVCASLAAAAEARRPLLVSVAAGITTAQIAQWLGASGVARPAIVRTMPNAPALLGAGVTGLFATAAVDASARARADSLLSSAGPTVWLEDEALMDAVTAVSGSGPAYAFLLAEAMEAAGVAQGLSPGQARALVGQTLLGAGRMLVESGEPADVLRQRVTSPGGTTEAAIAVLTAGGLAPLVRRAIAAARERGHALSAAND